MTIWRIRIACWIPSDTNTQSEYVTFIGFPLQQQFHERASMLRYTYSDSLVSFLDCFKVMLPVGYRKLVESVEIIKQLKNLLIKRYILYKVLACSTAFFKLSLFCAIFFQLFTFIFPITSKTSFSQRVQIKNLVFFNAATCFDLVMSSSG